MRQIVCSYLKRKGITLLRGNQTEIRLSTAHFIRNVWPWRWISRWVAERIKTRAKKVSGCSKLISGGKTITLEPSDGNETITKAGDVFTDWIDSDFRNYGTDVRSQKTGKINTEVHELIKDGDYQKIFGSLSEDPKKLCFTQLQIIQFVKNHRAGRRSRWNAEHTDGTGRDSRFTDVGY